MYNLIFYEGKDGRSDVADLLKELRERADTSKDARVNFYKIVAYLDLLSEKGPAMGEPVSKYLGDGIWELRPLRNRILYACCDGDSYIILHHFIKKTRKTPAREIRRAKENLKDYKKRNEG